MSTDACDIKALVDTEKPDWAAASKIYIDGKNSKKSDGTIRTLRGELG